MKSSHRPRNLSHVLICKSSEGEDPLPTGRGWRCSRGCPLCVSLPVKPSKRRWGGWGAAHSNKNSLPHPSRPYRCRQPLIPSQVAGSADRGTLRELTSLNYIRSHRLGDTSEQNDNAVWEPTGPFAPGMGLEDFVSEDAQSLPLFFFFKNT